MKKQEIEDMFIYIDQLIKELKEKDAPEKDSDEYRGKLMVLYRVQNNMMAYLMKNGSDFEANKDENKITIQINNQSYDCNYSAVKKILDRDKVKILWKRETENQKKDKAEINRKDDPLMIEDTTNSEVTRGDEDMSLFNMLDQMENENMVDIREKLSEQNNIEMQPAKLKIEEEKNNPEGHGTEPYEKPDEEKDLPSNLRDMKLNKKDIEDSNSSNEKIEDTNIFNLVSDSDAAFSDTKENERDQNLSSNKTIINPASPENQEPVHEDTLFHILNEQTEEAQAEENLDSDFPSTDLNDEKISEIPSPVKEESLKEHMEESKSEEIFMSNDKWITEPELPENSDLEELKDVIFSDQDEEKPQEELKFELDKDLNESVSKPKKNKEKRSFLSFFKHSPSKIHQKKTEDIKDDGFLTEEMMNINQKKSDIEKKEPVYDEPDSDVWDSFIDSEMMKDVKGEKNKGENVLAQNQADSSESDTAEFDTEFFGNNFDTTPQNLETENPERDATKETNKFSLNSLEEEKQMSPIKERYQTTSLDTDAMLEHLRNKRREYDSNELEKNSQPQVTSGIVFNLGTGAKEYDNIDSEKEIQKITEAANNTISVEVKDRMYDMKQEDRMRENGRTKKEYTFEVQKESDFIRKKNEFLEDQYTIKIKIEDKLEQMFVSVIPLSIPKSGTEFSTPIAAYYTNGIEDGGVATKNGSRNTLIIKCPDYAIIVQGSWEAGKFSSRISVCENEKPLQKEIMKKRIAPESMVGMGIAHNMIYLDRATAVHIFPVDADNSFYGHSKFMAIIERDFGKEMEYETVLQKEEPKIIVKGERYKFQLMAKWENENYIVSQETA